MDSPLSSLDHWTYPLPLPFAAHHPHSHQSDSSTSSASPQPSPFSFTTTSSSSSSLSGDDGYEEGKGGDGGVFGLLPRASLDPLLADDAAKGLGMGEGSSTPTLTPEVDAREEDVLPLTPPENFSTVAPLLYRSSFPSHQNFPFLKSLGLKTVLTLVQEDYPEVNREFLRGEGIRFFQIGIPGNKSPTGQIPDEKIIEALDVVFDRRNYPLLIHCNAGKHRTGCLISILRLCQHWNLEKVVEEYKVFAGVKWRGGDLEFMGKWSREGGKIADVWKGCDKEWLPSWLEGCEKESCLVDRTTTV